MARLVEHGLVDREDAGSAALYRLNREHLAAPAVDVLASLRPELVSRIRRKIEDWAFAPVGASLFGSLARGEGDTRSDIDVLLVRPDDAGDDETLWRTQVDDLATSVERWTGNHTSIVEVTESELAQLRDSGRAIVDELRRDALPLFGVDVARALEGN